MAIAEMSNLRPEHQASLRHMIFPDPNRMRELSERAARTPYTALAWQRVTRRLDEAARRATQTHTSSH